MCFEAPQVLEVLARPEQPERCIQRRLVAAARGVAYAGEQPAAALGVADVGSGTWRRSTSADPKAVYHACGGNRAAQVARRFHALALKVKEGPVWPTPRVAMWRSYATA